MKYLYLTIMVIVFLQSGCTKEVDVNLTDKNANMNPIVFVNPTIESLGITYKSHDTLNYIYSTITFKVSANPETSSQDFVSDNIQYDFTGSQSFQGPHRNMMYDPLIFYSGLSSNIYPSLTVSGLKHDTVSCSMLINVKVSYKGKVITEGTVEWYDNFLIE